MIMNKPLEALGRMNTNLEMQKGADDFGRLLHFILRHDGNFSAARLAAASERPNDHLGLTPRLVDILKAAPPEPKFSRQALRQKAAASPSTLAGSVFADAGVI